MSRATFDHQGYLILPSLLPRSVVACALQDVQHCIEFCASDLAISTAAYLEVVSRWHMPSPVARVISHEMVGTIQSKLETLGWGPLRVNKWNIITKNRYASGPIACHQDLPYSPESPYAFSSWIALNPITPHSGGLKVLPGSHQGPLAPAVDFWAPDFYDTVRGSDMWQQNAKAFCLEPGDGVLFDSQLWHGSDENLEGHDRYALVIRWENPDFIMPSVPPRPASDFGMWTCGAKTEEHLRAAMRTFHPVADTLKRVEVLQWWIQAFQQRAIIIPQVNPDQAVRALEALSILDQAAALHHGGDGEGRIYKQLYQALMGPLLQTLCKGVT